MRVRFLFLGMWFAAAGLGLCGCGLRSEAPRVEGQVQLAGRTDFEGVKVYLPGTARVSFTDSQGRFVLDQLPAGQVEMVIEAEGFQPVRRPLTLEAGQTYRITQPIQLTPVSLEAEKGRLRGTIALEGEETGEGTLILLQGEAGSTTYATDSNGHFDVDGLLPGLYQMYVLRSGYMTWREEIEIVAGEELDLGEVTLSTGDRTEEATPTAIRGRVTLEEGGDPSGVLVSVEGTSWVSVTDESGRFELSRVSPGRHSLSFQKLGYETRKVKDLVLQPGATEEVQVVLTPQEVGPTTGSVEGFVQFEGGYETDLSGIQIMLQASLTYQATTEPDGRYSFTGVSPGLYRLRAEAEGVEPYELLGVSIQAGQKTRVPPIVLAREPEEPVVAEAKTELSGTALLSGQSNHQGILVQIEGTSLLTTTDARGAYTFHDMPTGVFRLAFHHQGFQSEILEDVPVVQGQSLTLGPVTLEQEQVKPYVLSTEPHDGAAGVRVDAFVDVVIIFSERMDGGSLKRAFSVTPPVAHRSYFGGESSKSGNDRLHVQFQRQGSPTIQLNQEYTIGIRESARSLLGVEMGEPYEFSFETSGPLIVKTFPEDGAENLFFSVDDYLIIDFNTQVDYASFMRSLDISPRPASEPILLPERVPAGNRVKLEADFADDTRYTVTIDSRVRTPDGKPFDNTPYRFSFRTGSIQEEEDAIDDLILDRDYR